MCHVSIILEGENEAVVPQKFWLVQVMTNTGMEVSVVKLKLGAKLWRHTSFRAVDATEQTTIKAKCTCFGEN